MTQLTLTLKHRPARDVDMSPLVPERLAGKTISAIGRMRLATGNRKTAVSSLFEVTGKSGNHIQINNSCDKLVFVGHRMTEGTMEIRGKVGDYLGKDLQGGTITVSGHAGDWIGSGMKNGLIEIKGNAGSNMACAIPGDQQGMKGGFIHVRGNAGDRIGDRMRRGTVVIEGNAGNYCGARMLAGTIVVLGTAGNITGFSMKRGTLVLMDKPAGIPATFNDCGNFELGFLGILFRDLANRSRRFRKLRDHPVSVQRYAGDLAWDGKGELLLMQTRA